jgi:hypothetical protein
VRALLVSSYCAWWEWCDHDHVFAGVRTTQGGGSTQRQKLFLFNDLVLVTTAEKQPTLKYRLSLDSATVKDVQDLHTIKNAFQVRACVLMYERGDVCVCILS